MASYAKSWHSDFPSSFTQKFFLEWKDQERHITESETQEETTTQERRTRFGTHLTGESLQRTKSGVDDEHGYAWNTELAYSLLDTHSAGAFGIRSEIRILRSLLKPHNVFRFQMAGSLNAGHSAVREQFMLGGFSNQALEEQPPNRYRESESFPGLASHKCPADRFVKVNLEQDQSIRPVIGC